MEDDFTTESELKLGVPTNINKNLTLSWTTVSSKIEFEQFLECSATRTSGRTAMTILDFSRLRLSTGTMLRKTVG